MRYRLRTLITPPPFEDEEKARLASLLNVILLSALAILIVYSVVLLVTDPGDSLAFLFLSLFGVVELGLLVIMRRGHVQWVSLMLVLSAWMGLLIAGYTFGGVRGTSYTSLIVVVIIAGVLLGGQAAGVIALLSIVAGGVLWYAELTGRYAPKLDFLTPLNAWTGQAMLFILAAVLLNLADRSIRQALEQARRELAERRQTDARLRDSEERYRLISSVISDYTFFNRVGPRGELEHTWLAGAFESITGYTLEEFQALGGWRVTLHPDDVAQDERDMAGLHANQKVVTEVRIIRKEGDLRWVRVYARPLWDAEHSRLAGIYGAVQDITDRKQAEESLRRYATRMEVLHEIDRALLSAQSPQQIALATAENVRRLIGCQRVSIVLFDHQTESAHFIAVNTSAPTFLNTGQTVSFDDYGRHVIEAVERGESFVIEDVLTARVVAPADRRHLADGLRAWLCMPLFYHTELIGALNLGAATPGPFPAEQSEIAREVANQLAIAIQQNRLLTQTTEALAREQRLNEVARVISSSLDLSDTLSNIVRLAVEVVGAESGVMGLIAPDGQSLTHPYLFNLPDGLGLEQPIPKGSGIAWEVIESGQAVWLPDYRSHPSALPHWVAAGIHGFIETPLKTGDARLGILGLYQFSPQRRFDERDLALAEAVGQQAGVAIQNARLFEAERRRADEQEALRATLADLSAELEPARLLQAILERAVRLARTDIGELAIFDETTRELIVVTSYNLEKDYTGTRIALGEGTMGRVAQTRAPLIIDDYQQWERRSPQYTQSIFHAALVMPLLFGDRLLGAIGIGYLDPAQQFNPADLRLLSLFAAQAAIAIRNSQLFDAERRRIALLTALHETGLGLSAQLDLPVLLHTIVERAVRLLEARMGELYLVTPDGARLELVVNHNLLPDYIVAHLKMGEGVSGAVAATGQPLIVPDYKEWPTRIPRFAAGPYRAIISAPILWQDKVIGVFNVIDERPACFGTRDLDTMRQLAAQAAVAIQNARLFEATRRQLDELTVLQTVAMAAAESTSEDNLLEQTVQVIHQ
ncbi:MAG TPA: GAF domain-containing protein, partial [Anaerolineales bacterium]|nr:GAF domain-containing protein [Anaerolineales bacterium]